MNEQLREWIDTMGSICKRRECGFNEFDAQQVAHFSWRKMRFTGFDGTGEFAQFQCTNCRKADPLKIPRELLS